MQGDIFYMASSISSSVCSGAKISLYCYWYLQFVVMKSLLYILSVCYTKLSKSQLTHYCSLQDKWIGKRNAVKHPSNIFYYLFPGCIFWIFFCVFLRFKFRTPGVDLDPETLSCKNLLKDQLTMIYINYYHLSFLRAPKVYTC